MFIQVDSDSSVPIYRQIVTQITFAVAGGDVQPGQFVPSMRDLAKRLLVHPNTVVRAFQDLERLGVLRTKPGRGMEVTEQGPEICQRRRREVVRERLRGALRDAASSALGEEEVLQIVREEWQQLNGRAQSDE